ncbi:TPA: hypothetical protein QDB60_003256 [Burkholderia multivorans]|nr:hypothetical protein [Burkholderia multivorans]
MGIGTDVGATASSALTAVPVAASTSFNAEVATTAEAAVCASSCGTTTGADATGAVPDTISPDGGNEADAGVAAAVDAGFAATVAAASRGALARPTVEAAAVTGTVAATACGSSVNGGDAALLAEAGRGALGSASCCAAAVPEGAIDACTAPTCGADCVSAVLLSSIAEVDAETVSTRAVSLAGAAASADVCGSVATIVPIPSATPGARAAELPIDVPTAAACCATKSSHGASSIGASSGRADALAIAEATCAASICGVSSSACGAADARASLVWFADASYPASARVSTSVSSVEVRGAAATSTNAGSTIGALSSCAVAAVSCSMAGATSGAASSVTVDVPAPDAADGAGAATPAAALASPRPITPAALAVARAASADAAAPASVAHCAVLASIERSVSCTLGAGVIGAAGLSAHA